MYEHFPTVNRVDPKQEYMSFKKPKNLDLSSFSRKEGGHKYK